MQMAKPTMNHKSDGVILVMGVTGAGKSYFLNQLKSESVAEGHSLYSGTHYPSLRFIVPGTKTDCIYRNTEVPGCSHHP